MTDSHEQTIVDQGVKSIVAFCDAAARQVLSLMLEEGRVDLYLRVYVTGGGCSGFQYGFAFEDHQEDDDHLVTNTVSIDDLPAASQSLWGGISQEGRTLPVPLLVDPISLQYLKNAEIDYRDDVSGSHFVIRNPNAKTTCGCGSSFSTE